MAKLSVSDLDLQGERVLVRVDFNVPLSNGQVSDDTRLTSALPTIQSILNRGGGPVLMSHLGRPKGAVDPQYSLKPVAVRLQELLGSAVILAPDCVGEETASLVANAPEGSVVLLENLRFHAAEEANDPAFALELSKLGDLYVNDAFGTAHRAHASTEGVTHYFATCAAGLLMQKEIDYLSGALADPERPFTAVLGGAKVSGKIDVIENLMPRVNTLLVGGGMAFTFFKAMGLEIGKSLLEEDRIPVAEGLLKRAEESDVKLVLPVDTVTVEELEKGAPTQIVKCDAIPADREGADIGPETRALFAEVLVSSKTVVWNGPMGVFEIEALAEGTKAVAAALAEATEQGATTIIGGGETAAAVAKFGLADRVSHVSTGGGASLEFLEGKELPGVEALTDKT